VNPRKIVWAFSSVIIFVLALRILELLGIVGVEVDILIRWLAAASTLLLATFIGVMIGRNRLSLRGALVSMVLGVIVFPVSPIVGMLIAVSLPPTLRCNPIVFGIFVAGLPLFVLGFLFWLRKKGFFKSMKMSWTDKEM
jgi:hypothetical protein